MNYPLYIEEILKQIHLREKRVLLKVCTKPFTQGCKLRSWKQWGEERFESMLFEIM